MKSYPSKKEEVPSMITKEDLDRLREQLIEDPGQVFVTNEHFKLLLNVITVWRPDLKQESEALIDELQALSKLDPPVAFNDRRVLELTGKYSDVSEKITEEITLRKEYIELVKEDNAISARATESARDLEKKK